MIRYGVTIGYATRAIEAGDWVREDRLALPEAPPLDRLELATAPPQPQPPLEGITFEGYPGAHGTGTKNILAISTTVQCVAPTVEFAVRRIKQELLPRYPNVDDCAAITHAYGCGVAIDAPGAEVPIRTLRNLALNPNLGGEPLVVSLGCEKMQPARMDLPVLNSNEPWVVRLQDEEHRGFGDIVAAIMRLAEKRLERLNRRQRVTCPASELVVGLQCGGSDAFSGVTATPEVARALVSQMRWYDDYLRRGGVDRSANPTPGNKRGGLSNIVEKALGSVAKAGSSAISGVYGPGEKVRTKGLLFAATPASDFICGTLQLAAGMNVHIFTTGEGTPYGLALAPVIKVASRTALAERWPDLIDIDAGRIATGGASVEDVGREIFAAILDVASGRRKTWADHWGLHNAPALFNPAPVT